MTSTTNAAAHAVEQHGFAIMGIGPTPAAAVADANEFLDAPVQLDDLPGLECRTIGELRIVPASAALLAELERGGDPGAYDEADDGTLIAMTEAT